MIRKSYKKITTNLVELIVRKHFQTWCIELYLGITNFINMVKVNESRYIALFVVTRFIKKLFNYLVFLNIFFKKICQARSVGLPHIAYILIPKTATRGVL